MNNDQLQRYSRQILLPEIDIDGQRKLAQASVAIVGCGGLGSHVAMALAGAGVGHLYLVDFDRVELSNLHRQTYYSQSSVGELKTDALMRCIEQLNNDVSVQVYSKPFEQCTEQLNVDLVIDATDGYDVRVQINRYALSRKLPWISAAAIAWQGQWVAFTGVEGCYECMYPNAPEQQLSCESEGVVGPLLVQVASQQSLLALKILLQLPVTYGRLTMVDALRDTQHSMQIGQCEGCVCSR